MTEVLDYLHSFWTAAWMTAAFVYCILQLVRLSWHDTFPIRTWRDALLGENSTFRSMGKETPIPPGERGGYLEFLSGKWSP